ncbi:MAG: hypothetical protein ACYDDF_04600 [Thermoplasmatota archaeon]
MTREEGGERERLSRDESEITKLLVRAGLDARDAKILTVLARIRSDVPMTSAALEKTCRLRQPEITSSARRLAARGWLKIGSTARAGGRGRAVRCFSLLVTLPEVVDLLAADHQARVDSLSRTTGALRELTQSPSAECAAHGAAAAASGGSPALIESEASLGGFALPAPQLAAARNEALIPRPPPAVAADLHPGPDSVPDATHETLGTRSARSRFGMTGFRERVP